MNWSFQTVEFPHHIKIACHGLFTVEECLVMQKDLLTQPFWQPGLNILFDFRRTLFESLKLEDLRFLAEKHAAQNERIGAGKIAALMGSTRDFGIGRQYELLTEATVFSEIMIFRDERKAIDWLASNE